MEMFTCFYPTLAISTIYCCWSPYRRKPERALREEVAFMLWVLAHRLPELQGLFRDRLFTKGIVMSVRREAALLGLLILAVAMLLGPKIVGMSKPLKTKTGSAEPGQQPPKIVMFPRVG
jgi:hypothetical protein